MRALPLCLLVFRRGALSFVLLLTVSAWAQLTDPLFITVVFSAKHTVRDYLNMVGGTTRIADEKQIYVIKVTGAAVSAKAFGFLGVGRTWDGAQYVSHAGGVQGLRLDPGDTIVVPERYDRIAWLKQIKDITSILGQIAVTAGVILPGLK